MVKAEGNKGLHNSTQQRAAPFRVCPTFAPRRSAAGSNSRPLSGLCSHLPARGQLQVHYPMHPFGVRMGDPSLGVPILALWRGIP